jgi:hypothetical protein
MQKETGHRKAMSATRWRYGGFALTSLSSLFIASTAGAMPIDVDNPEVRMNWDTTIKESLLFRVTPRSAALSDDPVAGTNNADDGDRNFGRGLDSVRTDLYSEFDASYRHWGVRISGEGWYDPEYLGKNANKSPSTSNNISNSYNHFVNGTERAEGEDVALLDAFIFGQTQLGSDSAVNFRIGRHSLVWGETLFYGSNGIAGGQSPVDLRKLSEAPSTPFREVTLPVNQLSAEWQITPSVSLAAYYQFEWEGDWLPAAGSYFSTADFMGAGNQSFFLGQSTLTADRTRDAKQSGQGGLALRISTDDVDYGLYAINYHEKSPQIYVQANGNPALGYAGGSGSYQWVYPENIQAYGASASTSIGNVQLASEVSMRRHMDLASNPYVALGYFNQSTAGLDNDRHTGYATGDTVHANISALITLAPNVVAEESSISAEIAANRVMRINSDTEQYFATYAKRNALGWTVSYTPTYRQVLPSLDLEFPITWNFSPLGKSGAVGPGFGTNHGGYASFGMNGTFRETWKFGLSYTHYYGPKAPGASQGYTTFAQSLYDRDFMLLSVSHTF